MWWCNNCKREMEGFNVTYEEYCYICGHPIMSLDVEYSNEDVEFFIQIGMALMKCKNEHISLPMQYMNDFATEETLEFLKSVR